MRSLVPRFANGHTIGAIAARRSAGSSWQEIARDLGLTRPHRGPKDVRWAALMAWQAAGRPGNPKDWPERPRDADVDAWLASPEVAPFLRARDEAIDRWLAEVARGRTEGAADAP